MRTKEETVSPRPRWLALVANTALIYPLIALATLYAEWLLAWYVLGHRPRPSLDDPKFIVGSNWMHPFVTIVILGMVPFLFFAIASNLFLARKIYLSKII